MNKYKILVLTDHLSHTQHDSIFPLFKEIASNSLCESLYIGSRGVESNIELFKGNIKNKIYCKKYDKDFTYINKKTWHSSLTKLNIHYFDVLFLRIDYPINKQLLINLDSKYKGLIINHPIGTLKTGSKGYLVNFNDLTPKTFVTSSLDEITTISNKMDIVVKPLRNYGGKGLIRLGNNNYIGSKISSYSDSLEEIKELLEKEHQVIVNEYLYNVDKGDKRIIVVNGTILGAMLRLPEKDNWLCNLKQGGRYVATSITSEESTIAKITSDALLKEGVVLYGFDTLVNNDGNRVLTELNTSNVGGFLQIEELTGSNIINTASIKLFDYIEKRSNKFIEET